MKLNQDEIKTILPHREPMLLVTSVEDLRPGEDIRAVFFADSEMDIFRGHFPEEPILPGVYSIECMAQAVDILLMTLSPAHSVRLPQPPVCHNSNFNISQFFILNAENSSFPISSK